MTTEQAAAHTTDLSPSETMALNNLLTDAVIGVKSDDGSNYGGNISSLANKINSLDDVEFCTFTGILDGLKKKGGKNPPCQ